MSESEINKGKSQRAGKAGSERRGAPKGNRYAAKVGDDLRLELYLSKTRRTYMERWYELRYQRQPSEDELRDAVRILANSAIHQAMIDEFERHQPGLIWGNGGEVF